MAPELRLKIEMSCARKILPFVEMFYVIGTSHLFQKIQVGTSSPTSPDAKAPPENAASLSFSGCAEVDLRPRLLNSIPSLRSVNVTKTARMVVAPRIYDSRAKGNGESAELEYIEVSQVCEHFILIYRRRP